MLMPGFRPWPVAAAALCAGLLVLGCHQSDSVPALVNSGGAGPEPVPAPSPGLPWFEDVAAASGIDFRHYDSSTPLIYVPEQMGSGLGWIDYDNDGWPDLFCVQDGPLRPGAPGVGAGLKPASTAPRSGSPPTNKLYRNNG